MEITIDTSGAFAVARLKGEFGMYDGEKVSEQLQPLVAEPDSRLAVTLDEVTFINSDGLNALIAANTRARLGRSRMVLVAPSSFVKGVLEVTQLDQWFDICDDLDQAAERLS